MSKFIVIYHAPASFLEQSQNMSPEDMQKGMEPWMAWAAKCGSALVDMGSPLAGGQKVSASGTTPSDKQVAGYSVLEAPDMAGAVALLQAHPHLNWAAGCEIEVHEAMPMGM
jgi:YCII-related domain